jgi:hypothetical protein
MKLLSRALFLALILTEILAWMGVLPLPQPDFSWFGLVGTALAVWIFVEAARLPGWMRLYIWLEAAVDAAIDCFHIYSRWYPSDRILHFWSGTTLAIIFLYLLLRWSRARLPELELKPWLIAFLVIGLVCVTSLLYESWEFFTDLTYLKTSKALGDGRDTVDDQLLGLLGGISVVGLYYLSFPRRRESRKNLDSG